MAPVPLPPTATSFTCNAWWSGDDKSVLVRLEGHDAADKIAYVIRTQKTFWEIDQLEYIAMVGPSGGIYLDVGSNIGNHAVFFGRFCADHVVAIEPNPRLHPILRRNIDANALGERTTVVPVGISDTDVVGAMALRDEHDGNIGASHIVPGPAAAAVAGERVELRRLDDLIAELAPSLPSLPITFLKIDVEGMEMGVLSQRHDGPARAPAADLHRVDHGGCARKGHVSAARVRIHIGGSSRHTSVVPLHCAGATRAPRQQMARWQPSLALGPHGGGATGSGHVT